MAPDLTDDEGVIQLGPLTFGQIATLNDLLRSAACQRSWHQLRRTQVASYCSECGTARQYHGFEWTQPRRLWKLGDWRLRAVDGRTPGLAIVPALLIGVSRSLSAAR